MQPADAAPLPTRRFSAVRVAGYAIGILLLLAAVVAVTSRTNALREALASARAASPWLVAAVILLPLLNIAVISASFWALTSRFGRIRLAEMTALIVSSWLLNHLPLRPGLLGRIGYHRAVNGIPVRASLRVIIEQLLCGLAALAFMVITAFLAAPLGTAPVVGLLLFLGVVISASGLAIRSRALSASKPASGACITAALGLRLLDMTLWIVRYLCLFALVGHDISLTDAAAITAASQAAMLSPVPLGLREWVVGAVHAMLGAHWISDQGVSVATFTPGVSADLVNRAAELLVALPLGIAATLWLFRRARASRAVPLASPPPHPASPPSV